MPRHPPNPPLFPSTTLFRSHSGSVMSLSGSLRSTSAKPNSAAACALRSEEHTSELQSQFHLLCPLIFFNAPPPPKSSPLPLHDALPISQRISDVAQRLVEVNQCEAEQRGCLRI